MKNPNQVIAMMATSTHTTGIDIYQQFFKEDKKAKHILSQWCLDFGQTYHGSMLAIKHHCKVTQRLPVCISVAHQLLFYPIAISHDQLLWIKYYPLGFCKKIDQHTTHVQVSATIVLEVPVNIRMIKRQLTLAHTFFSKLHAVNAPITQQSILISTNQLARVGIV